MRRNKRQKLPAIEALVSNLPCEIINHILLRLPVKSLLRFKCVCKSWNTLISDPQFIHSHHIQLQTSNYRTKIVYRDGFERRLWTMRFEDGEETSVENLYFPRHRELEFLSSCQGMVMLEELKCYFRLYEFDPTIYYLWNPSVRKYTKFSYPFEFTIDSYGSIIGYGLYYEALSYDYKVMVIHENHYFTYSVGKDSWGDSKVFPFQGMRLNEGVFVNGSLHWVATRDTDQPFDVSFVHHGHDCSKAHHIICFDPKEENFCMLTRPDSVDGSCVFDLAALGGSLVLHRYIFNENTMKIWLRMGNDYKESNSWEELMVISGLPDLSPPVCFHRVCPICYVQENELMLYLDGVTLLLYDVKKKTFRDMDCVPSNTFLRFGTYTDSLLLPGVTAIPKRKWLTTEKKRSARMLHLRQESRQVVTYFSC